MSAESSDGGWYDAEGNYCYANGTYYDPEGKQTPVS